MLPLTPPHATSHDASTRPHQSRLADRRLRTARRHPNRCTGRLQRFRRLAVHPSLRWCASVRSFGRRTDRRQLPSRTRKPLRRHGAPVPAQHRHHGNHLANGSWATNPDRGHGFRSSRAATPLHDAGSTVDRPGRSRPGHNRVRPPPGRSTSATADTEPRWDHSLQLVDHGRLVDGDDHGNSDRARRSTHGNRGP